MLTETVWEDLGCRASRAWLAGEGVMALVLVACTRRGGFYVQVMVDGRVMLEEEEERGPRGEAGTGMGVRCIMYPSGLFFFSFGGSCLSCRVMTRRWDQVDD